MTASGASASALDKGTPHRFAFEPSGQENPSTRGIPARGRKLVFEGNRRSTVDALKYRVSRRFLGGFPVGAPIPTLLPMLGWACRNSSTSLHYPRNLAQ